MHLSPKQTESIVGATAPVSIWHGAVRSGKTTASVIAFLDAIARSKSSGGRIVIIGRTMDTIYRNVIAEMVALLGPSSPSLRYTRGSNVAYIFGHEVDIIGASDARSESRIRGMTIKLAYVDEASLLPDHAYWQQLLNRQLTVADARTFITTNPDHPMHWLKTEVIDQVAALGYASWHFVMDDNPALTEDAKARASQVNTGMFHARNVLGLWVMGDGVIWDGWRLTDTLPVRFIDFVVGIDYGTHGTHAAVLLGLGSDDRIYACSEWRWVYDGQRGLSDVEMSRALRTWLDEVDVMLPGAGDPMSVHVDPSAVSLIEQLHRDRWHRIRGADNAVLPGLRSVSSLFALDRLRIHESCTGLIGEIPGYVWDDKAERDQPVKAKDHSCDALRYGAMGARRWWRRWLSDDDLDIAA